MYFIELLVKRFKKKQEQSLDYDPLKEEESDADDICKEHVFMPIDSSGETLACRNCGLVVERKNLKDINFFRNRD